MNQKQLQAFCTYVGLGSSRSLAKAAVACGKQGQPISEATLKRYSVSFSWQARLERTEGLISEQVLERLVDSQVAQIKKDLQAVSTLKARFRTRAEIDPMDCRLPTTDQRRAVDIGFRDYLQLLQVEQKLLGFERIRSAAVQDYDPSDHGLARLSSPELKELVVEMARRRYGLPPETEGERGGQNAEGAVSANPVAPLPN